MFTRSTFTSYLVTAYRADGTESIKVAKHSPASADDFALSLANSLDGEIGARVTITAEVTDEETGDTISILIEDWKVTK